MPPSSLFRALATSIVPEAAGLDEAGWLELERIVAAALAERLPGLRRQLLLFVRALDLLPLLRWGRRFTALEPEQRVRFLTAVQG